MLKLTKTQKLVRAAILLALTIVLSVPPLSSIRINPAVEITFSVVPVALGGLLLGWPVGLALGSVFGIISFFRFFTDALGMLMISQNLFLSFLTAVVPRIAVGLLADGFGQLLRRREKMRSIWFYAVAGFACSLCNTVLFLGFIWLIFDSAVTSITLAVIVTVVSTNGLIEMLANAFLVSLLARVLIRPPLKD